MPEEISKGRGLSKLFYFFFFHREQRGDHPSKRTSVDRKREESEVDSASSCSPKHMHRPCCERNFTGYIDKRAGSQVGRPGGGEEEKGDAKKRAVGGQLFRIQFLYFVLLETYETKRNI